MPSCDKCGEEAVLRFKVMSDKWCEACYGPTPKREFGTFRTSLPFDSYHDHALGAKCTSYAQQERVVKKFNEEQAQLPEGLKDYAHPDGFTFMQDDHKFMSEQKNASRRGNEIKEMQMKSPRARDEHERKNYKRGKRLFFT